jgi:hypothetical protein
LNIESITDTEAFYPGIWSQGVALNMALLKATGSEECQGMLVHVARVPSHSDILASRRPVVMPTRGGMKDFRVDGSERQATKLELFHEASRVLFAEEHVVTK